MIYKHYNLLGEVTMSNEQVSQIINELKNSIYTKYMEAQNKFIKITNLKVGDRVKVLRKANNYELGWCNTWNLNMDKYIGKIYIIKEFFDNSGIVLGDEYFHFPFFVLEKVEEPKYQFKDKDVVLVRNDDNEYWCMVAFKEYNSDLPYPYICYSSTDNGWCWKQCIPYERHEHLLGTTQSADC